VANQSSTQVAIPLALLGSVSDGKGLVINAYGEQSSTGGYTLTFKVVSGYGDLRGLFVTSSMSPSQYPTQYSYNGGARLNVDKELASDVNMSGVKTSFAQGFEIGTAGIGKDDVSTATFYFNGKLSDVDLQNFGLRVMSTGIARNDSAKLVGTFALHNLSIDKTASVENGTADGKADNSGDIIKYTITVKNTGAAEITNLLVKDDNLTPSLTGDDVTLLNPSGDNGNNKLDVGETWTYTYTHKVLQGEIDAGTALVNTATVTSSEVSSQSSSATTGIKQNPLFEITKTASVNSADRVNADKAGEIITYTVAVKNTGNVTLSGVSVSDDNLTPSLTGDDVTLLNPSGDDGNNKLDVGETWTYTYTHEVLQKEMDAGSALVNTATASSTQTGDSKPSSSATTGIKQNPLFEITKTASVNSADRVNADKAGEIITYTVAVKNTGNVTLSGVSVSDDNLTPSLTGDDVTLLNPSGDDGNNKLDVGETWTYTYTHEVTQEEMNAGTTLVNTAKAYADGVSPQSSTASVNVLNADNFGTNGHALSYAVIYFGTSNGNTASGDIKGTVGPRGANAPDGLYTVKIQFSTGAGQDLDDYYGAIMKALQNQDPYVHQTTPVLGVAIHAGDKLEESYYALDNNPSTNDFLAGTTYHYITGAGPGMDHVYNYDLGVLTTLAA